MPQKNKDLENILKQWKRGRTIYTKFLPVRGKEYVESVVTIKGNIITFQRYRIVIEEGVSKIYARRPGFRGSESYKML